MREPDGSSDWEIYDMNPDGSEQTNLTNDPADPDYSPAWSPDGHLAFARQFQGTL